MTDNTTPSSRPDDFAPLVVEAFRFLTEQGFESTTESADSVLFEGAPGVFVRVFRDPRDRHVGFRAGLTSRPRDALTVPELARLTGADFTGQYPESGTELRAAVTRLARLLEDFGSRVLEGDGTILDEAMTLRSGYTRSFTNPGNGE